MDDEHFNDNELDNEDQVSAVDYESEQEEIINDEPESQIDEDGNDIITDNALYNITASEDIEFNTDGLPKTKPLSSVDGTQIQVPIYSGTASYTVRYDTFLKNDI